MSTRYRNKNGSYMNDECDKCGAHMFDLTECSCPQTKNVVRIDNQYRGKCVICNEYLGNAISIHAARDDSLRNLKENQKAHLDCYIDHCVEIKVNELLRNRPVL